MVPFRPEAGVGNFPLTGAPRACTTTLYPVRKRKSKVRALQGEMHMGKGARAVLLGFGLLFLTGGVKPLFAQMPLMWDYVIPSLKPSKLDVKKYQVGCYDIRTGQPGDCYMSFYAYFDSSWVAEPMLVDYTGGHLHPLPDGNDPNRPVEALTCPAVPSPPGSTSFEGSTNRQYWTASKVVPQVSGVVTIWVYYMAPYPAYFVPQPGWVIDRTPTGQSRATTFIGFKVGLGGIGELPSDPDHYVRCGVAAGCTQDSVEPRHPGVFFGTGAMLQSVQKLAFAYLQLHPDLRLRILDMSLPAGGVFDYKNFNWTPPHSWHRVGESVDIGEWVVDSSGNPAYPPGLVQELENLVNDKANPLPLHRVIESGGRIHYQYKGGLNT